MRGCSVFTRPPSISGLPVSSATSTTARPGVAQRGRGAARRDELDAERREPAGELDQPGLVGNRQQRTRNAPRRLGGHAKLLEAEAEGENACDLPVPPRQVNRPDPQQPDPQ